MLKLTNKTMLLTRTTLEEASEVSVSVIVNVLMNDYSKSRMLTVCVMPDYTLIHLNCSVAYFNLVKSGLL